jgi:hypothetical protein
MLLSGEFAPGREQQLVQRGQHRDMSEVAQHVDRPGLEQRHADRHSAAAEEERIAVGRCGEHGLGPDAAGAAGTVVDHELLAEPCRELLGKEPHAYVGEAARPIGQDDRHRPFRISGLGRCWCHEYRYDQRRRDLRERKPRGDRAHQHAPPALRGSLLHSPHFRCSQNGIQ